MNIRVAAFTVSEKSFNTVKIQNSLIVSILAMTLDFQRCGILISVDSDEPVQPPLTPLNRVSFLWNMSKQCRPRSDTTEWSV